MSNRQQSTDEGADDIGLNEFLSRFITPHRLALFDAILEQRTRFLTVVLESVDKGHNACACLRSCECFGIQDCEIIRRSDEFKLRNDVISGAFQWLTVRGHRGENESEDGEETVRCFDKLRKRGYRIVAVTPNAGSVSVRNLQLEKPSALVFGSELEGLSDSALHHADDRIHIPMHGFTESFNLSVAVAICLHELRGKLDKSGIDISLTADEKQKLKYRWMKRTIGHKFDAYVRRYEEEQNVECRTENLDAEERAG